MIRSVLFMYWWLNALLQKPLPEDPPWYELFCAKKEELYEVASVMLDLYSRPPEDFCPVPLIIEKQAVIEASPAEGASQQSPSGQHKSSSKAQDQVCRLIMQAETN